MGTEELTRILREFILKMRILIHLALFAMLAGFLIPSIDGCCCNVTKGCVGSKACNIFGCNCETYCYNGRCGYCARCTVDVVPSDFGIGGSKAGPSFSLGFAVKPSNVALHNGNLECCSEDSGCRRRRRSSQDDTRDRINQPSNE